MKYMKNTLAAIYSLSLLSQYAAAHYDFKPGIANGQVVTGGHDDEAGLDTPSLRIGGFDFGENADDPYNIGDPGFNTLGPSAFAGGSSLRLSALAVGGAYLSYWNGSGEPTFTAAAAGTSLALIGSPTRLVTLTSGAAAYAPQSPDSLLIGSFTGSGAMHIHLTSSIADATGTVPTGAYLISLLLQNPGTGVADSAPLYIVFNNGLTEDQHDAAIDAVTAAYVPEPAALGLLAAGGLLLKRRRKDSSKKSGFILASVERP